MKSPGRTMSIAGLLTAGILFTAASLRPQPPGGGPGWQYCAVTAGPPAQPNRVVICHATADGCRNENVFSGSGNARDPEMAAVQKLGDQGWELVAATQSGQERTLYFKRLKALDNQHPLGN